MREIRPKDRIRIDRIGEMSESKEDSLLPGIVRSIISSYGIRKVYACKSEEES